MSSGTSIATYAKDVASSLAARDGPSLAALLDLQNRELVDAIYASLSYSVLNSYNDAPHYSDFISALRNVDYEQATSSPWPGIASRHLSVIAHIGRTDSNADGNVEEEQPAWEKAFAAQLEAVKSFIPWFQDGTTGWALPVLYTLCRDLKALAIEADKELTRTRERANKLEEASRLITKGWTACLNDRVDRNVVYFGGAPTQRRKLGTYYMATLLFKIYFKLETLGLCKNIVRGIQNTADLPPLETFPKAHQVTYRYYLGIFDFLNERYEDAEKHLLFAFEHCHKKAYKNQGRILSYLVPLRLLRGVLPSSKLLSNFPRLAAIYNPFVQAYRLGDLKGYDDALLAYRGELVRRGTFLVIERARQGCLRMLFKKVWLCSGQGSRLLVATVQQALAYVSVDVDSDEVECLLANLIFKGHLKGYISHERQTVVLAKDKPFPVLIGRSLQ